MAFLNKDPLSLVRVVLVIALAALGVATLWVYSDRRNAVNLRTQEQATASVVQVGTVPPIDAAAPSQTEVATFAMG